MTATNDITGDAIKTGAVSKAYADNYDKIFGSNKQPQEAPITVWLKFNNDTQKYDYNHYEEGWLDAVKPTLPQFEKDKSKWSGIKAYLIDGKVCYDN